jgi:hypothetical protein
MTSHQPPDSGAVMVSAGQVNTLLTALYEASGHNRNRVEFCIDCPDQSCATCQWRLKLADTYDQTATELILAAEAAATRQRTAGHAAADPEAGQ